MSHGKRAVAVVALVLVSISLQAAPNVGIRLPERFRLLTGQRFDLRVEASSLAGANALLTVVINGNRSPSLLPAPEVSANNDPDAANLDKAWTYRNVSFPTAGVWTITATVSDGGAVGKALTRVGVQGFHPRGNKKSVILFIGDAMGTAYRDAGRLVAMSTRHRFREGFFDELQEMDSMPVSGMVMTYAMDRIVPDSANTATAWSTGNKTIDGALGVFPDNDDWRFTPANQQGTKQFALNNPKVETLWEYLKRLHGYKTGIVSTADVTDATPAGEGAHTITRILGYDIAKQFVDGVFTPGPTFDVILGGGKERFISRTAVNSGDVRNLAAELQRAGYSYVQNRTELKALSSGPSAPDKLLGLFRTGNMNVAYDKLMLSRPPDEQPTLGLGGFTDQPFLDEMTEKAISVLSKNGSPFILLVEGASIDKQSHPNHAAGVLWDTIEFDKAVGVGRIFAAAAGPTRDGRDRGNKAMRQPLILVTADHDQSMGIVGLTDTSIKASVLNTRSNSTYPVVVAAPPSGTTGLSNPGEVDGFTDYEDVNQDGYPENTNRYRLAVGFRTGNHTGSSVPITAEGPGALLFTGYFDQTDIFFKIAKVLSSETAQLDQSLNHKQALKIVDQNY